MSFTESHVALLSLSVLLQARGGHRLDQTTGILSGYLSQSASARQTASAAGAESKEEYARRHSDLEEKGGAAAAASSESAAIESGPSHKRGQMYLKLSPGQEYQMMADIGWTHDAAEAKRLMEDEQITDWNYPLPGAIVFSNIIQERVAVAKKCDDRDSRLFPPLMDDPRRWLHVSFRWNGSPSTHMRPPFETPLYGPRHLERNFADWLAITPALYYLFFQRPITGQFRASLSTHSDRVGSFAH